MMDISASAVLGRCLAQHSKSTAKRAQGNGNEMAGGAAAGESALLQMIQPVRREGLGLLVNQPPNSCCTQPGVLKDTSFGLTTIPATAGVQGRALGRKVRDHARQGPSLPYPSHAHGTAGTELRSKRPGVGPGHCSSPQGQDTVSF